MTGRGRAAPLPPAQKGRRVAAVAEIALAPGAVLALRRGGRCARPTQRRVTAARCRSSATARLLRLRLVLRLPVAVAALALLLLRAPLLLLAATAPAAGGLHRIGAAGRLLIKHPMHAGPPHNAGPCGG